MNHALLEEVFRRARSYHGALAGYAAAMRAGTDIEGPAQCIIGASLRYRMAIDRLLENYDPQSSRMVEGRGRLERLRRVLATTSRRYNLVKRLPPPPSAGA
jgi:hypothetical protein